MHVVTSVVVYAPPQRVFDLARDPDVHVETASESGERIVTRTGSGLLELGDEVTFEARHFWIRQRLTSKIVVLELPVRFVDEMQRGAFKSLRHEHRFDPVDGGTRMTDTLDFEAPFGLLGMAAGKLFLEGYMRRFLERRGEALKRIAEGM